MITGKSTFLKLQEKVRISQDPNNSGVDIIKLLDHLEQYPVLLCAFEAAKLLNVSRNNFKYNFIETGLITPLYIKTNRKPRFSLSDVLNIPTRMKERQIISKNQFENEKRNYNLTDLAFAAAEREVR